MNINPFELMKNLNSIQNNLTSIKEQIGELTATGSSGAGMVEATMNGNMELTGLNITDEAYALGDRKTLEVLVIAAVNDASKHIKEKMEEKSREIAAKMGMPV